MDYVEPTPVPKSETKAGATAPGKSHSAVALEPDVHVVPNTEAAVLRSSSGVRLDGKRSKAEEPAVAPPQLRTRLTLGTSAAPLAAAPSSPATATSTKAQAAAAKPLAASAAGAGGAAAAAPATASAADDYWAKLGSGNTLKSGKKK